MHICVLLIINRQHDVETRNRKDYIDRRLRVEPQTVVQRFIKTKGIIL